MSAKIISCLHCPYDQWDDAGNPGPCPAKCPEGQLIEECELLIRLKEEVD